MHKWLCITVKIFKANISNDGRLYQIWSIQTLERVGEIDHTPTVCVAGCWVVLLISMSYCTHHRCMSMYISQRSQICYGWWFSSGCQFWHFFFIAACVGSTFCSLFICQSMVTNPRKLKCMDFWWSQWLYYVKFGYNVKHSWNCNMVFRETVLDSQSQHFV